MREIRKLYVRKSQVFHWYPRDDASVFSRRKSLEEVVISSRKCVSETLPAKPDS